MLRNRHEFHHWRTIPFKLYYLSNRITEWKWRQHKIKSINKKTTKKTRGRTSVLRYARGAINGNCRKTSTIEIITSQALDDVSWQMRAHKNYIKWKYLKFKNFCCATTVSTSCITLVWHELCSTRSRLWNAQCLRDFLHSKFFCDILEHPQQLTTCKKVDREQMKVEMSN